jgi:hypothetical protein
VVALVVLTVLPLACTGCSNIKGEPVKTSAGSLESELEGEWEYIHGSVLFPRRSWLTLSYRQEPGQAAALTGKLVVSDAGGELGGNAMSYVLPKLKVSGWEAAGEYPNPYRSSQIYSFKIRLDDHDPDLLYFTLHVGEALLVGPTEPYTDAPFKRGLLHRR